MGEILGVNANRAYSVNGLNQYIQSGSVALGYDAKGNLTSSGSTTYAYTAENRLKSVSGGVTLSYDPLGRLQDYDTPTVTRFVYDGTMISEEISSTGAILRRYVTGPDGEPAVWYEGSGTGTKRYLYPDERGSVIKIANQDDSVYALDTYDEYGIPGAANQGRFQYTGQAWLSEIGLQYSRARIYSPTLGRFLQTDPTGYAEGPNWYNYTGSNPVNFTDPSGMDDISVTASKAQKCNARGGFWMSDKQVCAIRRGGYTYYSYIWTNPSTPACLPGFPCGSGGTPFPYQPTAPASSTPQKPNPPKNDPDCKLALAQQGNIAFEQTTASLIVFGGITASRGSFINLRTGTTGHFFSVGGGIGLDNGISEVGGTASSLALFDQGGVSANISAGPVAFSANGSLGSGGITPLGKSAGLGLGQPVGGSVTASGTNVYGCTVRGQ